MEQIIALLVGLVSSGLVEGAKRIQAVPLDAGQVAKLRIVLGVLVLAGNTLSAYLNGNLDTFVASDQVSLLVNSALSWVFGHLTYKLGIKPLS